MRHRQQPIDRALVEDESGGTAHGRAGHEHTCGIALDIAAGLEASEMAERGRRGEIAGSGGGREIAGSPREHRFEEIEGTTKRPRNVIQ